MAVALRRWCLQPALPRGIGRVSGTADGRHELRVVLLVRDRHHPIGRTGSRSLLWCRRRRWSRRAAVILLATGVHKHH